jgi:hypothetical protein
VNEENGSDLKLEDSTLHLKGTVIPLLIFLYPAWRLGLLKVHPRSRAAGFSGRYWIKSG